MSKDYYKVLGISKSATKDEVKKAYRKLAQKYHPDKKDGDEKKFKEVNEAYTILSDDKKRSQYDQFGQTFSNSGGTSGFEGFDFSQFTNQHRSGGAFEFDLNDILGNIFGGGWSRTNKGRDIHKDIEITFKDSILGVLREIVITREKGQTEKININIPPGIDSGEMLRYKGKGEPIENGIPGDLYIRIHVKPHSKIKKEGIHLIMEENIKITESFLGTKKTIETIDDNITVSIPKGIRNGEFLRVKGKGVPITPNRSGDLLIKINIETPKKISRKAEKALETLQEEGL